MAIPSRILTIASKYEGSRCKADDCIAPNIKLGDNILWASSLKQGKGSCYHIDCWNRVHSRVYPGTHDYAWYRAGGNGNEPAPSLEEMTELLETPSPFEDPSYEPAEPGESVLEKMFESGEIKKPTGNEFHVSPTAASTAMDAITKAVLGPLVAQFGKIANIDKKIKQAVSSATANLAIDPTKLEELVQKYTYRESKVTIDWNGELCTIEGLMHKDVATIAEMLVICREVYAYGGAGAGKTYMGKQVAELLGLDFYPFQIGKMSPESSLKGFIDGNGNKQEQRFLEAIQKPSLVLFDEFDRWPSHITTLLNGFLANNYIDARGHSHPIIRDPKCYILALGNTTMRGRDEYFPEAVAQEFPTMDRFKYFHVEYDAELEKGIALGINPTCTPWITWVQSLRPEAMSGKYGKVFATPRSTYDGARLLRFTKLPVNVIIDATVFKGIDKSTRDKLITQFPVTDLNYKRTAMQGVS